MKQMPLLPRADPGTMECRECGTITIAQASECPRCGVVFAELVPSPPPSRDVLRSRRKRAVRARSVSMKRLSKRELEVGRLIYPPDEHAETMKQLGLFRPRTRGDCDNVPRPCPFVSCSMNNYLDVSSHGAIKLNFPDLEPWEVPAAMSCTLDVVDKNPDGATLEHVGEIMNLTRERIRQLEERAKVRIRATPAAADIGEAHGLTVPTKRRLPLLEEDDEVEQPMPRGRPFDVDSFVSDELDAN